MKQLETPQPDDRTITAYHEAGHYVVGYDLGLILGGISIRLGAYADGRESKGRCEVRQWSDNHEANAIFCLGGVASSWGLLGVRENLLGMPEHYDFLRFADKLGGLPDSLPNALKLRVEDIIIQNEAAVKALASALLERETLTGPEAMAIIEKAH